MNWFKNLKITAKLALSFGVLLAITTGLGAVSESRLSMMAANSSEITRNWLPCVEYLNAINTAKSDMRVAQLRYVAATTAEEAAQFEKHVQDAITVIEENKRLYVPLISDDIERGIWNEFDHQWQAYLAFSSRVTALWQQGKHQDAAQAMRDSRDLYTALGSAVKKDIDRNVLGANNESKVADDTYAAARLLLIEMIAAALVLGGLLAFFVGRAIGRPLAGIIDIFKRITSGRLDNAIEVTSRDEIGAVLTNLSEMQSQMRTLLAESQGQLAAINRAQAVIEFALDGTITGANDNFLNVLGYRLEEIKGQHHRMFVDPVSRASEDYKRFWEKLARGEFDASQYKRVGKGGKELWIQASYNPIFNADGKPYKVVKYATDVTEQVNAAAENGRIKSALDKASASVMLADDNLNIIYVNESAQKLFRDAETEMRRDLPALHADRIVGSNIDIFHKNPSHQRQLLANLRSTHTADVRIGGRAMRIAASPVLNAAGNRFGTVVEWFDRTQEVRSEEQVAEVVKKALEGDLVERLPMEGKTGFFAALAGGLNQLLDNTAQMVQQIKVTATEVHRGAEEISQGNANLSQRTEEQSSSLEETASSMEEMTSTVKQNADNAGQANQLATAARDQAEKGGSVVGKAVKAMADINESSKKIADIISVIDEIAFQTNLLALNAAVEAARAGEQGRGFAVVATEVRSLAGRSATAAKEIKDLIQDSVKKVEDGSVLVTQSGQTLEQIVTSVKKVSDIVAEIASASREQSSGIEQVNGAVMQMDEMTQQNAALVEQATAASQSMAEQARDLTSMMERYRVSESRAASVPVAAPRKVTAPAAAAKAERRGGNRPWVAKPKGAAKPAEPAEAPIAQRKAAANGAEADWHEF